MKKSIALLIAVLFSLLVFPTEAVNSKPKAINKPKKNELIIGVMGTTAEDYAQATMHIQEEIKKNWCDEEFTNKPVLRLVSITKDGKVIQERRFDAVIGKYSNYDLIEMGSSEDKSTQAKGYKSFCIHMKHSTEIVKIQLYKDQKLLTEAKVKRLEDRYK